MSKLSDAAHEWLKKQGRNAEVSTESLWQGVSADYPHLTAASETRKTPRTTLMRDLRTDRKKRFVVGNRKVKLADQ